MVMMVDGGLISFCDRAGSKHTQHTVGNDDLFHLFHNTIPV